MLKQIKHITSNRYIQYILFWAVSYYILVRYFSLDNGVNKIDVIYTGLFLISIWVGVIVNSFLLIPHFLARKKYAAYGTLLLLLLSATTWLNIATFTYLANWLFPDYFFISYYGWQEIIQFIIIFVGVTTLLQLSRGWFEQAEMKQEIAELKQENTEAELKTLRAQMNPHFLFNSLNHIYALAIQDSPKTGSAVLELSELLRYNIGNKDRQKVRLDDEIKYIQKYIELYKSRVHHPERIELEINNPDADLLISPLLLIVFIENCFKHGSIKKPGEKIDIAIRVDDDTLSLKTQNWIGESNELPNFSSGTGYKNVRRRLELLYPDKHTLIVTNDGLLFRTELSINLS